MSKTEADIFRFIQYNTSNDLPSNCVRAIIQDNRGFMWFGTANGLTRFDGYTFKSFRLSPCDSAGLGCNYIYSLYEDKAGRLWVGTQNGVYLYMSEKEHFDLLDIQTETGVQIYSHITALSEDKNGMMWIATIGQGVFSYQPSQHMLKQYCKEAADKQCILTSNQISYLYIEEDGTIWATPRETGIALNRYDPYLKQFIPYIPEVEPDVFDKFSSYAITEMDGYVWVGSWINGLYRLDKQTGELKTYMEPGSTNGAYHIHSLLPYGKDLLLIGSDDGLHCFNLRTEACMRIHTNKPQNYSLSDKFIYPIYQDREGGLWVGTYYGGINYSPPRKGDFEGYTHDEHIPSIGGNIISCFCEDEKRNIWIGTDDGGLSYFNTQTHTFTNYRPEPGRKGLSYHNIHALCLVDGKLWIGTYSGGLNVLDLKTMQFKWYVNNPHDMHSLDDNGIYSIYKDSYSNLWIGSMRGLMYYDSANDHFERMKYTGYITSCIIEDGQQNIWFATKGNGLHMYSLNNREWKHFQCITNDNQSIPSNLLSCLCVDRKGRLWVGSDRGLCEYNKETGFFIRRSLPIPSSVIYGIIAEGDYLWLTTSRGLVRYMPDEDTYHVFTQSDGLQSDQFTINAIFLASSGKMYLGTVNGLTVIVPSTISKNNYVPPVYITKLQLFNKDESVSPGSVLSRPIEYTKEIAFSYKQNMFSLEFVALSYSMPLKNRFMYQLDGFDKDWNEVNTQRKATYTNLPAGKYLFRVIASNDDGIWNKEGASVVIIIHPPFWRTSLAYLIYILLALGIVGFATYRYRRFVERRHQLKMQQLNTEKEKEIHEAKIQFFTLITHEIRTPLSLIVGPLEKIIEENASLTTSVQNNLKIIERNSNRLLSLVNQLLDFKKVNQGVFAIHFSLVDLYELLHSISVRFIPMIEQKGISFVLGISSQSIFAMADTEALTKMVSNLLTNAIKHAKKKITLSADIVDDNYFFIKVSDDGCGIPEEEQKQIFAPFYQVKGNNKEGTGLGLSLVKLLTDAHQGMIEVDSHPDKGAAFTLTLPLKQPEATTGKSPQTISPKERISSPDITPIADKGVSTRPILLIVEDNSEMSNFLCETFECEYDILLAENGKEGLELLNKHVISLIISDVIMPVMDGIKFIEEVRKMLLCSHIPIILLSAKTDNDSKVVGIKAGADIYVEKPFSSSVLRAHIENLLTSRKVLRRKFAEMPFIPLDSIAGNKADEVFLTKMNRIIEKNISNTSFTIDLLAEQLCVSRSGLFAKIKKQIEMTPNELIQLIRLKKAAEMLTTQKYRVNEICYQVGFNSPSHFTKCFQKQFGVLPKDFKRK
jgi:signal transduction histidine kinase/ligand-binding sensor domain-containing protein/DNA-binding response OmpR family regulator